MAHNVLKSARDRLVVALQVRQRGDQCFLQTGDVRLTLGELLGEYERRQPIAFVIKRIKQQFFTGKIVRPEDEDRA